MPQNPPAVAPEYRPSTRDELAALPEGTIVAMAWEHDLDPDLFRHSPSARQQPWALLTAPVEYGDWERWSLDDLHSEHALYAVIYQPA